ncbi:hypothetical protein OAZ28_01120 [bacterium]|nr:hypothetical protein [Acidimicrobiaceae bacterium]MDC3010413.1 hypothetical protein [bacterium]
MTELNKILKNETENPFHSYLLISSSSKYLIEQSKLFSSSLLFNENQTINHPDIRVVTSENQNTLGVNDIRQVINDESIFPIEGQYKIFIFPPDRSLTEEASNALLKTLEEPSESNIFIITSNGRYWSHTKDDSVKSILPTLKSRCRTIYIDDEFTYSYNFDLDEIINFLDIDNEYILNGTKERLESISSTLQELKTINSETNERLFKFIELEKKIDDLDIENVNTVKVFQSTIEYLVNSILSIQNFSKIEFRYSELLTNLIEDLSNGIRPKIAINNLIVESSKL